MINGKIEVVQTDISKTECLINTSYSSTKKVQDIINIKPLIIEMSEGQAGKFMHQTNMYRNNGKDFLRIHYDDYMGLCGYVFYVGEYQWKYDWGGLLQVSMIKMLKQST